MSEISGPGSNAATGPGAQAQPRRPAVKGAAGRRRLRAIAEIRACERAVEKSGENIVSELLRHSPEFYEWQHYPDEDAYDPEYHAQYYYHAHPGDERVPNEHGHFHTFLRPEGMPRGLRPLPLADAGTDAPDASMSHLVGISMDPFGKPFRLFVTNRWVTAETWYPAAAVIKMTNRFAIDHARPSWVVNRWVTAFIRLFHDEIASLLRERDAVIRRWQSEHPETPVYEDRRLNVVADLPISLPEKIAAIEALFAKPA